MYAEREGKLFCALGFNFCQLLRTIFHPPRTREPPITHACNPTLCRKLSFGILKLQHIISESLTQETISDLYNSRQLILKCSLLCVLGVLVLTIHPWAETTTNYIFRCLASRKVSACPSTSLFCFYIRASYAKRKMFKDSPEWSCQLKPYEALLPLLLSRHADISNKPICSFAFLLLQMLTY